MSGIAYFYIYKDSSGDWRWKFTAVNGKIIAVSSEAYRNLADCEHSVELLKQSGSAPVIGDADFSRLRP